MTALNSLPVSSFLVLSLPLQVMRRGSENRSSGRTNMNEHSSRSHLVMSVTVTGAGTTYGEMREETEEIEMVLVTAALLCVCVVLYMRV